MRRLGLVFAALLAVAAFGGCRTVKYNDYTTTNTVVQPPGQNNPPGNSGGNGQSGADNDDRGKGKGKKKGDKDKD